MRLEHVDRERLAAYQQRRLTPEDLLAVDEHLAECHECRGQLESAQQVKAMFAAIKATLEENDDTIMEHISYEQLEAYVDKTIDDFDRELVDTHVETCQMCAEELRDLQAFSAGVATLAATASEPAVPLVPTTATLIERARSFLRRLWAAATVPNPVLQPALGTAVLILGALLIREQIQYRRLEQQSVALSGSLEALRRENESLRSTTDSLQATNRSLTDRIAAIEATSTVGRSGGPTLQDTVGTAALGPGDTVILARATLPPEVSQSVRELLTTGEISAAQSAQPGRDALRGDVTRSSLRAGQQSITPLPMTPVLTGVRSTTPTLRWSAIGSVQEYKATIADEDGNVVWQSSSGARTSLAVPPRTLQRGRVYFWQVEASSNGQSRLSPTVGFWVLDEAMLREIETIERSFQDSALVLTSAYAAHGLYEEALAQVDRLAPINPGSKQLEKLRQSLRRQLGRE